MKMNHFILLILCLNVASGLANGKPWVPMLLSPKVFIMLTDVPCSCSKIIPHGGLFSHSANFLNFPNGLTTRENLFWNAV